MDAADKRLNEMNRLGDMGHFPALVNAGATANVLLTMTVTWVYAAPYRLASVQQDVRAWFDLAPWIAIVLTLNLLPVVVLRRFLGPQTVFPRLREMSFVGDQHKFSDWVYVVASANMAFWIALTWWVWMCLTPQSSSNRLAGLGALLLLAALATFSPVLLRVLRRRG